MNFVSDLSNIEWGYEIHVMNEYDYDLGRVENDIFLSSRWLTQTSSLAPRIFFRLILKCHAKPISGIRLKDSEIINLPNIGYLLNIYSESFIDSLEGHQLDRITQDRFILAG